MNGKIAFERGNATAEHDIYAINPDGSGERNLTHNGSNNRQIAWAPDGSRIAFFSDGDGSDNYYDIHVARADGGGSPLRLANTGNARQPAWSPDGQSIAFVDNYIYTVHPNGTGLRTLAGFERTDEPAWSPDGTRILFRVSTFTGSSPNYERWDLYVVNPDGSGLERLSDDLDQSPSAPSWSPDGTRIAYLTNRDSGCPNVDCYGLYVMNADGTNERRLTNDLVSYPTWSPDGSRIAFTRYHDVFTIDPYGTGETRVTSSPADDYSPEWSPDSKQLVFFRSPNSIYTIGRAGSGERYVTEGEGPQWQSLPRGKKAKRFCKAERRRLGKKHSRENCRHPG